MSLDGGPENGWKSDGKTDGKSDGNQNNIGWKSDGNRMENWNQLFQIPKIGWKIGWKPKQHRMDRKKT